MNAWPKPLAITEGEWEEDLSLFDLVKGRGLAKQDQSSSRRSREERGPRIFENWILYSRKGAGGRLFPKREEVFSLLDRLLTFGEEADGEKSRGGVVSI